mmetsp:Transcript_19611/g.45644  ORF Transcript_19611/g.45644 Transcript_19611/m.45644 type:complete len:657 (+) Transcript_19611:68-2038(+)
MKPSRSAAELILNGPSSQRPPSGANSMGRKPSMGKGKNSMSASTGQLIYQAATIDRKTGLTRVEFRHTGGGYGLFCDGVIVVRVSDQAKKLGVQPGWKIQLVDDQLVRNSEEIWFRLQDARWQWRSCSVSFCTDLKAIRAEQARKRAEEIEAETARLAKLPFPDSEDRTHLEQLRHEFPQIGTIDNIEDRAITLSQLKTLLGWAKDHCHRWRDADPMERSKTSRQQINISFMNMYHLNHWLIKPATKAKDCSMMELITGQKQPPTWFVVFWWGDVLTNVQRCLEAQVKTRELGPETTFWIDALALRPHSPEALVHVNPKQTAYYKAMLAASFRTIIVLDPKTEHCGPATPFRSAWCCYQMALCAEEPNAVVDLAMCDALKVVMLTHGLTKQEEALEETNPGSGFKAKTEREKSFNPDLLSLGVVAQMQTCIERETADRNRILNALAGRDLDATPLEKHDGYSLANQRLHGLVALMFWRRTMSGAADNTEMQQLQVKLSEALRNDTSRQIVDVSMAFMTGVDEKIELVARSFPIHLRKLHLDLRGSDVPNHVLGHIAATLPRELEDIRLDLSHNSNIVNKGVEEFVAKITPKLKGLKVGLDGTAVTKEVFDKRGSLQELRQHVIDEMEKGFWCYTLNLHPSKTARGKAHWSTDKCKI